MISTVVNFCFLTGGTSRRQFTHRIQLRNPRWNRCLHGSAVRNHRSQPINAGGLTGFSLTVDPTGEFSTSSQVSGALFAASYTAPTPSNLTTAIGDMLAAFNDANNRTDPDFTNLGADSCLFSVLLLLAEATYVGAIGGLTLAPGLYTWTTGVGLSGSDVTISGAANDSEIFHIRVLDTSDLASHSLDLPSGGTFTIVAGINMVLSGGALASNIVWVTTGAVSAGAGAHLEGVILGQTSIALTTGTTANSRLLAQTAVTLQMATVTT
ncbi:fungal antifreeze protein exerts hyperactivity By constructing an inequable beta-helix [Mycena galericulata]|nr:fungal antifreeze protein exerts hyperactivity By constructing an inequable beta-helix [Mycena galericulata]